jgi:hypothetical protein
VHVVVSGASDDLIEIELGDKSMEFPMGSERGYGQLQYWQGDFIAPDGEQARVFVIYDGCWHASAGQVDEDVQFPEDWGFQHIRGDRDYVTALHFSAPDGTRLTNTTTDSPDNKKSR